jgi:multiple sugar transport system substrate-binding protein
VELLIPSYGGATFYRDLASFDISWDNDTCREVLTTWKRWVENGWWYSDPRSRSWSEALGLLTGEQAAMAFIGTYAIPILEDAGWVFGEDFDIFLFPQINQDYSPTLTGPFDAWCVSAKALHPEEAARFIAFLATTEAQTARAVHHGGLACNRFVSEYSDALLRIIDALDKGAEFVPGFFQAAPPLGLQLINHAAMPDFYDNPDIGEFIERCLDARDEYLEETGG